MYFIHFDHLYDYKNSYYFLSSFHFDFSKFFVFLNFLGFLSKRNLAVLSLTVWTVGNLPRQKTDTVVVILHRACRKIHGSARWLAAGLLNPGT